MKKERVKSCYGGNIFVSLKDGNSYGIGSE